MLKNKFFVNSLVTLSMLLGSTAGATTVCHNHCEETCSPSSYSAYTYFKIGGGVLSVKDWKDPMPAIGVGRRFEWGTKAVDISANYSIAGKHGHYFSIPKIMYLQYLTPYADCSPYLEGGLSWGELHNKRKDQKFQGVFGELAVGYEFHRHSPIRTFIQLDLSQGLLANNKHGSTPAPALALSAGIGF
jgi:hypothetical protein